MKDCYPKKSSSSKRGRNGSALIRPIWLESGTSGIATQNFCHTIEALIHFMAFMEELWIITTKLKNSGESLLSIILIAKNQWGIGPKKHCREYCQISHPNFIFFSIENSSTLEFERHSACKARKTAYYGHYRISIKFSLKMKF